LMSGGVIQIWVLTSEMGFGSSPSNTLYSRVTSWGRERAGFSSAVRSKESRIEFRFGGSAFASCPCNESGKNQVAATRESRTIRLSRLYTIQDITCAFAPWPLSLPISNVALGFNPFPSALLITLSNLVGLNLAVPRAACARW
jgi:hypothetical protein